VWTAKPQSKIGHQKSKMPKFSPMLVLLAVLIFVHHTSHTFFILKGLEFPPLAEYLYTAGFICAVGWWIREENRRNRITPLYCDGILIVIGWPVLILYYLLKTRGLKGFIPLLGLIVVFVVAIFVGALASVLTGQ
jgi:hypothetical protein